MTSLAQSGHQIVVFVGDAVADELVQDGAKMHVVLCDVINYLKLFLILLCMTLS